MTQSCPPRVPPRDERQGRALTAGRWRGTGAEGRASRKKGRRNTAAPSAVILLQDARDAHGRGALATIFGVTTRRGGAKAPFCALRRPRLEHVQFKTCAAACPSRRLGSLGRRVAPGAGRTGPSKARSRRLRGHSGVHGVAEPQLEVLVEQLAAERHSLDEHVKGHEAQSLAVHEEALGEDAGQLVRLGHVVEPSVHVVAAPGPGICKRNTAG